MGVIQRLLGLPEKSKGSRECIFHKIKTDNIHCPVCQSTTVKI